MASGGVIIRVTDSLGHVQTYGVPGENDVDAGFLQTRPLEVAKMLVDAYVDIIQLETEGTTGALEVHYRLTNSLDERLTEAFVNLGTPNGSRPMYLAESEAKVGRLIEVQLHDSELVDWTVTNLTIFGEVEGDEDQIV